MTERERERKRIAVVMKLELLFASSENVCTAKKNIALHLLQGGMNGNLIGSDVSK